MKTEKKLVALVALTLALTAIARANTVPTGFDIANLRGEQVSEYVPLPWAWPPMMLRIALPILTLIALGPLVLLAIRSLRKSVSRGRRQVGKRAWPLIAAGCIFLMLTATTMTLYFVSPNSMAAAGKVFQAFQELELQVIGFIFLLAALLDAVAYVVAFRSRPKRFAHVEVS